MKKIFFGFLTAIAVLVSCNKETVIESTTQETTHTISATIDDEGTKTTYTADGGVFSWVSGDVISFIVRSTEGASPTNKYDRYTYSTTGSGAKASFSGTAPSGEWSAADYAFYPYNGDSVNGYDHNRLEIVNTTDFQAFIYGVIKAYPDRLKGIVPMIGKKIGEDASGTADHYHFYPVTGILKLSFTGLPSTASQIRLSTPNAATYPLRGTFNIDTSREIPEIKASDIATGKGYRDQWLNFVYSSSSDAFYIPIPTGTIPAGDLTISVTDGTSMSYYTVNNKEDIVITRGEIVELPQISIPSVKVKISGPANDPKATFFFSGDVSYVRYTNNMRALGVTDSDTKVSTSGTVVNLRHDYNYKWPFQFKAYNSSDELIGSLQTVYYYSVNSTGITEVCKQFTSTTSDIGLEESRIPGLTNNAPFSATTPTITFEVSDDSRKGSIMVTEFCGIAGKVYASYVDYYDSGSGTPKQGAPQIITNNEVFCTVGGNNYTLKENAYASARFGVKTTVYGTPTVYGKNANLVSWGEYVGLYSSAGWGPNVHWYYDPAE